MTGSHKQVELCAPAYPSEHFFFFFPWTIQTPVLVTWESLVHTLHYSLVNEPLEQLASHLGVNPRPHPALSVPRNHVRVGRRELRQQEIDSTICLTHHAVALRSPNGTRTSCMYSTKVNKPFGSSHCCVALFCLAPGFVPLPAVFAD